ncbi:cytochrome p450 domain-containing protein [Ditylenchus destructor]|uniref:Cytochrome p450 domain-containing protein n=1 Tax=Ditylenchus destructor TaxID=166010 RepID=A0AAD4MXH2_9BILA|nr:cytochrome p450 domain-containing protein [Ditylenchus destructor]
MLIVFLILLTTFGFYNFYWKRRKFPPGPVPLPLFGNTLELANDPPGYGPMIRWHQKYGPVFTVWLLETPVIVIADYTTLCETFGGHDGDAYAGIDFMVEILKVTKGIHGIGSTQGEEWRSLRRTTLHVLRNLGMGRPDGERLIMDEVDNLLVSIQMSLDSGRKVFDLLSLLEFSTGSIINKLVFGYRFTEDKKGEFNNLKKLMTELEALFSDLPCQLVMEYTWLRHLPYFSTHFNRIDANLADFFALIDTQIRDTMKRKDGGEDNPDCFIDAFLRLIDQCGSVPDQYFNVESLRGLCYDLITAGDGTIHLTISFFALYMVIHQGVQKKVQDELDSLIGNQRPVTLADKPLLPYTNAVIMETQRVCNLLPFNLIHRTTRDIAINGYKFPQDTRIVPQISCVLYDEKIFPDSKEFRPERFLTADGRLKNVEGFIPFSIGKRICPGESLTKMELFLIAANLLNQFKLSPEDPLTLPSTSKLPGVAVAPIPFLCRVEKRYL